MHLIWPFHLVLLLSIQSIYEWKCRNEQTDKRKRVHSISVGFYAFFFGVSSSDAELNVSGCAVGDAKVVIRAGKIVGAGVWG